MLKPRILALTNRHHRMYMQLIVVSSLLASCPWTRAISSRPAPTFFFFPSSLDQPLLEGLGRRFAQGHSSDSYLCVSSRQPLPSVTIADLLGAVKVVETVALMSPGDDQSCAFYFYWILYIVYTDWWVVFSRRWKLGTDAWKFTCCENSPYNRVSRY